MTRIFWESTIWPDIYQIVWSTDSAFACAKDLEELLADLQTNGMTQLQGGLDLDELPATEKRIFRVGNYVTVSAGVPPTLTVVAKPETPEEATIRSVKEERKRTKTRLKEFDFRSFGDNPLAPVLENLIELL